MSVDSEARSFRAIPRGGSVQFRALSRSGGGAEVTLFESKSAGRGCTVQFRAAVARNSVRYRGHVWSSEGFTVCLDEHCQRKTRSSLVASELSIPSMRLSCYSGGMETSRVVTQCGVQRSRRVTCGVHLGLSLRAHLRGATERGDRRSSVAAAGTGSGRRIFLFPRSLRGSWFENICASARALMTGACEARRVMMTG